MPNEKRMGTCFQTSFFLQEKPAWESCPLFSGSSGNAIYIGGGRTKILVDAGMSATALVGQLLDLGVDPADLNAILVTHEHSDHIKGVGAFARKYGIALYVAPKTWARMEGKVGNTARLRVNYFEPEEAFTLGDMELLPFRTSHDAVDPVGFRIETERGKVAVCTDLGQVTESVKDALAGVDAVYLEANYDEHLLFSGPYPYPLKRRISGDKGHLSNVDAGFFAAELVHLGTENIVLSHLSKENNFPELAELTVMQVLRQVGIHVGEDVFLDIAPRHGRGKRLVME